VSLVVGLNHAFKFAPVIGRILADLATTGSTAYPIDRFRVDRFGSVSAA
jgi:sarcosine oxidase